MGHGPSSSGGTREAERPIMWFPRAVQVALRTLAAFTEGRAPQALDDGFNAGSQPAGACRALLEAFVASSSANPSPG